ncbi:MAG TPA: hypothetical protein PLL20_15465 [Phycisphaerae bacterium]|nr:hypothetical protein [Phycisphaerae bacterium]HRR84186.1 hypothetical protein [Phycisphaerae bacterium]
MRNLMLSRLRFRWLIYGALAALLAGSLACEGNLQLLAMLFNTSSLGGTTPGRRANLLVKFVNQTAYRPVFTFGTYDPLNDRPANDPYFPPKFRQFVIDTSGGGTRLEPYSESGVITFSGSGLGDPGGCGRAISLGTEDFIRRIEDDETLLANARPEALRPLCVNDEPKAGIAFFREASAGPSEDPCETKGEIAATAEPMRILQGDPLRNITNDVRYPCDGESIVVITFVEESAGVIRIDVSVEPPAEDE